MTNVSGKLGNEVQILGLPRGVLVWPSTEGKREALVVSEHVDFPAFYEVLKVLDS